MQTDTYFIAEIGKACNGDLDYCLKLLKECKKAGVNAVRFHHFFLEESVHPSVLGKSSQNERAWSLQLKLPFIDEVLFNESDYVTILECCRELGLDFIATPWDIKSFELFREIGITDFKVHSMNAMNIPLISAILEKCNKLYLSTGGLSEKHVETLCQRLRLSEYNVVLLHAACAYPAPESILNMEALTILKKYNKAVGYSSNDLLATSVLAASTLGAEVIEKHVHLLDDQQDLHKASVNIETIGGMIRDIREIKAVMGMKIKYESRGEMVNQEILSKSIVLKNDVKQGKILKESDFALQLPVKEINSKQWFDVIGKAAARDLQKGSYLYSCDISKAGFEDSQKDSFILKDVNERSFIPGKIGVVARFKDIDEMIKGRNVDYVEIHYAASDLKKEDECKDYDLDLVVHLPEYADGKLLDLSSYDEAFRLFSVDVINKVMEKARNLKRHFKKCTGDVKFIVHPGTMTYPYFLNNPGRQYDLFEDSLRRMDTSGLEILVENMVTYPWFIDGDWAPKQGVSNTFLDAGDIYNFCKKHNLGMCLDLCHAKLYTNYTGESFLEYMKTVKPVVKHLHYSDCSGVDSEGLQVGEGDMVWEEICETFSDFQYGWTPEIWNGHHDHGEKFYEAHRRLNMEFKKFRYASEKDVYESKKYAGRLAMK